MKLKPLQKYEGGRYKKAGRRFCQGLFLVASLSATTLGGCGAVLDSTSVDQALDNGDLDAAAQCDGSAEDCNEKY